MSASDTVKNPLDPKSKTGLGRKLESLRADKTVDNMIAEGLARQSSLGTDRDFYERLAANKVVLTPAGNAYIAKWSSSAGANGDSKQKKKKKPKGATAKAPSSAGAAAVKGERKASAKPASDTGPVKAEGEHAYYVSKGHTKLKAGQFALITKMQLMVFKAGFTSRYDAKDAVGKRKLDEYSEFEESVLASNPEGAGVFTLSPDQYNMFTRLLYDGEKVKMFIPDAPPKKGKAKRMPESAAAPAATSAADGGNEK